MEWLCLISIVNTIFQAGNKPVSFYLDQTGNL
jgi:hypothetical protein